MREDKHLNNAVYAIGRYTWEVISAPFQHKATDVSKVGQTDLSHSSKSLNRRGGSEL